MEKNKLTNLVAGFIHESPHYPPTLLFNEGWLLRLVLDCASVLQLERFPLGFSPRSDWFSEGRIWSPFLPRFRSDPLSESHTHTDGVIGHIEIGKNTKTGLELKSDAFQFVVVEAKLGSRLSAGTRNAPYYDQAARTLGCMAETLRKARRSPKKMESLGFVVLAPERSIQEGLFDEAMDPQSILAKVRRRVAAYEGERDDWLSEWFVPMLDNTQIQTVSWEQVAERMKSEDIETAKVINGFYQRCLQYN